MIFTPAKEGWGGIQTQTRLMYDDLKVYNHIYTLLHTFIFCIKATALKITNWCKYNSISNIMTISVRCVLGALE